MNRNKVICKCRRLTKGDVADAVEQGAVSFRQDHNQAAEKRR